MKGKMTEEDDGDEIVAERRRPNYYYHQRWSLMGKNAEDSEGNEIYTISIFDREECTMEILKDVTNSFEWASEEALVYIAMEKRTLRPYKVNSCSFFLLFQIIKYVSYIVKHVSI